MVGKACASLKSRDRIVWHICYFNYYNSPVLIFIFISIPPLNQGVGRQCTLQKLLRQIQEHRSQQIGPEAPSIPVTIRQSCLSKSGAGKACTCMPIMRVTFTGPSSARHLLDICLYEPHLLPCCYKLQTG